MNLFAASNAPVLAIVLAAVAVLLLILISASVRMVREYERAVVFRLGRCVGSKGPGLFLIIPFVDKTVITNLQIVAVPSCSAPPAQAEIGRASCRERV